jgi:hypothetical protein
MMDVSLSLSVVCDFFVTITGGKHLIRYGNTDSGIFRSGSITDVYNMRMQGLIRGFLEFYQVGHAVD